MSPGHQILKVHQIKGTVLIGVSFVGYSEKKSPKVSGGCYVKNINELKFKTSATHSSVLAWRIPGTGEPGRLPSMGSHRVRHD